MTSPELKSPDVNKAINKSSTPSQNNYAAPHTPIASAKRPRQPGSRSSLGRSKHSVGLEGTQLDGISEKHKMESVHMTPVRSFKMTDGSEVSSNLEFSGAMSPGLDEMSPMHPARPVVDNNREDVCDVESTNNEAINPVNGSWAGIFSPVLNFLNAKNDDSSEQKLGSVHVDDDGDVTMADHSTTVNDQTHVTYPSSYYLPHTQIGGNDNNVAIVHDVAPSTSIEDSIDEKSSGEEQNDEREIEEEEFNPYLFIKSLPVYSDVVSDPKAKICLPPKDASDPPLTLVLDLDETLVHCTVEPISDADMVFPVTFNEVEYRVHVRTRPYLINFLESICKKFEVVIFTASQKVYANELLKRIDPEGKYIKHRIFREACLLVEGNYLKDLNVLNRNLASSVLVDNSPHAFGYQVDNGIPIESWFDDPNDTELLKLERFLETLHGVEDVRTVVRSRFQTYKLIRDA